jgi:hypothetical protein
MAKLLCHMYLGDLIFYLYLLGEFLKFQGSLGMLILGGLEKNAEL